MAKHVLFYDELEGTSQGADATIKANSEVIEVGGDAGGDLYKDINDKKKTVLRWLRLLFLATLALFVFQLLLGWAARAVTLIADSAHSGSDVVSYGLSLCIERLKYSMRGKSRITPKSFTTVTRTIDTVGSLASLVTLLFATWFATTEALQRLHAPSDEDSGSIGSALMFFAIVSTSVNIGLLVFYRYQKKTIGTLRHSAEKQSKGNPQEPCGQDGTKFNPTKFAWCQPCKSFPIAATQTGFPAETSEYPDSNAENTIGSNLSTLHMVIHPGCTCATGSEIMQEEEEEENIDDMVVGRIRDQKIVSVTRQTKNLNVIAAMLHLITDLLRSLLILGVSLLIQSGVVLDAEYADAICALVVGILVCVGSLALFLRVSARVVSAFRPPSVNNDRESQKSNGSAGTCQNMA